MREEFNLGSNDNTLFVTSQCDNRCLMCCQPPTLKEDIDYLFDKNIELIKSAPKELKTIGISGGEPALLGSKLIELIAIIRRELPTTQIHLLSNGRAFADKNYASEIYSAAEGNIIVGVPLHSDYEADHDTIAGAKGAYQETMYGLYNLSSIGFTIELRIVVNRINYVRLPQISEFIFKNLPFVSWVAFMGMEYTGYAIKHFDKVWIEPQDYNQHLDEAVHILDSWGVEAAIYNIPLCLLSSHSYIFAERSISDWKVNYAEQCSSCSKKDNCCGLFSTSKQQYNGIAPFE